MTHVRKTLSPDTRLYGILDTLYTSADNWLSTARAMARGGVHLVEVRAKDASTSDLVNLARAVDPVFRTRGIPLVVNDDLEAALAGPDWGLHIGQDDGDPVAFRQSLGPERILGLSTHSLDQARSALALPPGTLTYFAVGPVYATGTKPDYQPVGLDLVTRVAGLRPSLPWFAIGGINRRTLGEVLSAGASRVVVVSDILCATDPAAVTKELAQALQEHSEKEY